MINSNESMQAEELSAMTDKKDIEQEEEGRVDPPCSSCDQELPACGACGKREKAGTWWYIIALLVILILALVFKRPGGT